MLCYYYYSFATLGNQYRGMIHSTLYYDFLIVRSIDAKAHYLVWFLK